MRNNNSKRTVIDFNDIDPKFKFIIGKVLHNKASLPLEEHVHSNSIEISYFIKGDQVYTIEGKTYSIRSNEVFITLPGEKHGSGDYPKDKSILYYIQVDKDIFNIIGIDNEDGEMLLNQILNIEKRCFKAGKKIQSLLDNMILEGQNPNKFSRILIRNYISEFILALIKGEDSSDKLHSEMGDVISYIETNIKEDITIEELAEYMNISEGRFKVLFKESLGIPPKEYILRQKMKVAKDLLKNTDKSITEIAFYLGFSSSQYFTTVFKRFNIESPKGYRDKNKQI